MNSPSVNNTSLFSSLADRVQAGPGDIVIDCGANIGDVTSAFATSGAIIHAFEPNPHAYQRLVARFTDNANVICYPNAVWDRSGNVRLHLHQFSEQDEVKWSVGSSLFSCKSNVSAERFIEVKAIDLTVFMLRLDCRVKLLKIDIEGAEYETLTKLINLNLSDRVEHILVETHEKKIPEFRESHEALLTLIKSRSLTNIDLTWI